MHSFLIGDGKQQGRVTSHHGMKLPYDELQSNVTILLPPHPYTHPPPQTIAD